ncbi:MAG: hypothetical protein KDD38_07520, partial [Bdellovibrionales bacterium]|nr:hypothetical protein [Bdellovibrionales bacterium]
MLLKSLTYQFYISGVLAAGVLVSTRAYSIPVIDAPLESPVSISSSILESQQQLVWPTLSQDGFVKEVQFHKKRVELLSRFIGEYLGLNSRELILDVAHVHDDAKLTSEMTTELYEMYRDESVSKKATVKKVNDLDREITLNKLKELGLFDGVSIDTKALYAVFVVD